MKNYELQTDSLVKRNNLKVKYNILFEIPL